MIRAGFVCLCVAVLAGCGAGSVETETPPNYDGGARWYELPENREVLCIFHKVGYGAGLSCDWDNARARR